MKIIDDFLPYHNFKQIEDNIFKARLPWHYNPGSLKENGDWVGPSQLTHVFYDKDVGGVRSAFYSLVEIIPQKLGAIGAKRLCRIKGNLNPKTFFPRGGGYHTDYKSPPPHRKTAVYYINTNNGYTKVKGYGKVKSVANRLAIFDCNNLHQGVTCTDKDVRVVFNINYDE